MPGRDTRSRQQPVPLAALAVHHPQRPAHAGRLRQRGQGLRRRPPPKGAPPQATLGSQPAGLQGGPQGALRRAWQSWPRWPGWTPAETCFLLQGPDPEGAEPHPRAARPSPTQPERRARGPQRPPQAHSPLLSSLRAHHLHTDHASGSLCHAGSPRECSRACGPPCALVHCMQVWGQSVRQRCVRNAPRLWVYTRVTGHH